MKIRIIIAACLAVCLSVPVFAATLKVPNVIELFLVDGQSVSSGKLLEKKTNSIELNQGTHQIVFRVKKVIRESGNDDGLYNSEAQIATFDIDHQQTLSISLPRIDDSQDARKFDKAPSFKIITQQGTPLTIKTDVLKVPGLIITANYETEMAKYNARNNPASVPAFVHAAYAEIGQPYNPAIMSGNSMPQSVNQTSVTLNGQNVAEQMLQYWYFQADKATQQRFLEWAKKQKN